MKKYSVLPGMVKIGPVEYQVRMEKDPKLTSAEGNEVPLFGSVNFRTSEIIIDEDLTPVMQWQCLWHEITHIIFEQLGFENDNEGQVDALAYKIMEILMENGPLFPMLEIGSIGTGKCRS